jgi:transcriptional regulator with XRE-family HTH domain
MDDMAASGKLHKTFCANVLAARKRAGLTQEEAATRMEISRPRYTEIENGKFGPTLGLIERLAKALKTEPQELLDPEFASEMSAA